jgi:predicted enzyme related to lactoylglutathione lyase
MSALAANVAAMAYDFQVVVDAADPHAQADWWAQTLGWEVEASDEAFIRRMVDEGHARPEDTTTHHGVLVWNSGQAIRSDGGRRILFNRVPEAKTVKNRVHLDIRVGSDGRADVVADVVARGGTKLYEMSQGPYSWVTMTDPEGNEFCVA